MSVRRIQLGEYGRNLYFDAGTDISTATSHTVEFTKPYGDVVVLPATLGVADHTGKNIDCIEMILEANTYTFLAIPAGLIDQEGTYLFRALNPLPSESIPGQEGSFVVGC